MAGTVDLYYWDSCIFMAWLKDEARKPGEMEGVRGVVARWNKGEVRIITSTIMLTEVTPAQIPEPALSVFDKALRRRTLKVVGVATPDALHLATAIIHEADEFHTFDGGDDNKTLGLLGLSGNVAGHKLKIDKPPQPPQGEMDFDTGRLTKKKEKR